MTKLLHTTLLSGQKMPMIGLGTWQLNGKECIEVIKSAFEIGYRHIDTAFVYSNHKEIGKAIKSLDRNELFVTSKLSLDQVNEKNVASSVRVAVENALKELSLDYLDLYLIHWPDRTKPLFAIYEEMQELCNEGILRNIGVSNFTIHHLQDFLQKGFKIAVNQVEFHPYLFQSELWTFCKQEKIQIVSYRPLGKGILLQDKVFEKIAKKHQKTKAQVILRWILQKKVAVIPKAANREHLMENISIFDFELSEEEMKQIDALNRNQRFCGEDNKEFNY